MPLPLTVTCFSKIQIGFTFLVPAHLGSPGKRAVKWVCVCVIDLNVFSTSVVVLRSGEGGLVRPDAADRRHQSQAGFVRRLLRVRRGRRLPLAHRPARPGRRHRAGDPRPARPRPREDRRRPSPSDPVRNLSERRRRRGAECRAAGRDRTRQEVDGRRHSHHVQVRFRRGCAAAFSALTLLVGRQEGHPGC